jgi:hypothetical protein
MIIAANPHFQPESNADLVPRCTSRSKIKVMNSPNSPQTRPVIESPGGPTSLHEEDIGGVQKKPNFGRYMDKRMVVR